jgi:hypothetical protein
MLAPTIAKSREVTKKGPTGPSESLMVRGWVKDHGVELWPPRARSRVPCSTSTTPERPNGHRVARQMVKAS